MPLIDDSALSPAMRARLQAALNKRFRYSDGIRTLGADIEARHARGELTGKKAHNGMMNYRRTRFNRMDGRQQADYMRRLEAQRLYFVECADGIGRPVPKIVFDALALPVAPGSL